jgi:murein DD-endopeptidase MepM/ murein hydrolase activator NlpD
MSDHYVYDEPVPDYMADTGPIQAVRDADAPLPAWRRAMGCASLLGATALTLASVFILVGDGGSVNGAPGNGLAGAVLAPQSEATVTQPPPSTATPIPEQPVTAGEPVASVIVLPTLDPVSAASLLSAPLARVEPEDKLERARDLFNPFTIVPERTRSEVETYTVVSGDTIFSIAERFGLKPETIVWGNDRGIVGRLQPGQALNILPVDGVYYTVQVPKTIAEIAAEYNVDPYVIIDSEFNDLFSTNPDTVLSSGARVVIPGAEAEQIAWTPPVQRVAGAGGTAAGGQISFAPGDPGSCGLVANPGGGGGWISPVAGTYQWTRGFTSWHSGVDLSAPEGTPVVAANGGTVVFAGWSTWGYGNTVVLAHGAFTTLYGHMSAINVGCGMTVGAGQVVGAVGTTGNSSGPHLHFEIRYNDVPQDPTYTMPF